jgi:Ca2+:H+ antiporter
MAGHSVSTNPIWTVAVPIFSGLLVVLYFGGLLPRDYNAVRAAEIFLLCGAVFAAVHHAEVVSARVGEPFGSLILALAVTIIEVGLIVTLMLADEYGGATVARDTVYAAVMLVLTGLIGLCLVAGGHRHYEQKIRVSGTSSYLAVLGTLVSIGLILPNFTTSTAGPTYSTAQLLAASFVSLMLYGAFLFVQTVRHRDYFLAALDDSEAASENVHRPSRRQTAVSLVLLVISLACVILQAKMFAPTLDDLTQLAGLPQEFNGVVIAALVLAPESIAAVRASLANRPQTSINLALGSALASIALTIPIITALAAFTDVQLVLGVPPSKMILLALAMFVSVITLLPGRTSVLQGYVHLSLFIMFIVVAAVP